MPVFEAAFLFRLAPEDFVVAVRIERRVDVDEVDAAIRQLAELFEVVAAVDDARVDKRGGLGGRLFGARVKPPEGGKPPKRRRVKPPLSEAKPLPNFRV